MPTVISTPGAANANSYLTVAEAQAYMDTRLPLATWDAADQEMLVIMATRVLDANLQPYKELVTPSSGMPYYKVHAHWTGSPASTTQRLAWPRTGMYDMNGNAIASTVIPDDLKDATAELAGQLSLSDTTLDNSVIIQGLKSVSAGSVSLSFKDMIAKHVLPDAVFALLPPSWYTEETIVPAWPALFDVVSEL